MELFPVSGGILVRGPDSVRFFRSSDSCLADLVPAADGDSGKFRRLIDDESFRRSLASALALPAGLPDNATALAGYWRGRGPRPSAINLNLTPACTLNCIYCYARGGSYARIHEEMKPALALSALHEALACSDPDLPFRIEFFGGEPLMNTATISAVLTDQESARVWRDHPHGIINRISTNLTSADDGQADLLRRGRMILSVSIDGPREVQDAQRPFRDGTGSHATIMKNIRRLRDLCPDAVIVARMTVFNPDHAFSRTVREFAATGLFDYVSIYPAAVGAWKAGEPGHSTFSENFRNQYLAMADAYPELLRLGRFRGCLELNRYIESTLTGRFAVNHCRAGDGYFTLSPDGSVHPCHRIAGDTEWNLGSFAGLTSEAVAARLAPWRTAVDARPECRACALRYLCGGGCKHQTFIATGNLLGRDPNVCAFTGLLFEAMLHAVDRFGSGLAERLHTSFGELADLFVLCGQRTLPSPRPAVRDRVNVDGVTVRFVRRSLDSLRKP
ncbi:MAG TPA: radical SAM protein [Candidatus Ozemobacteraceae bacterium]